MDVLRFFGVVQRSAGTLRTPCGSEQPQVQTGGLEWVGRRSLWASQEANLAQLLVSFLLVCLSGP